MSWRVLEGDCVELMRAMPEASVDAVVCDPPYGLEFMGKEWDRLETYAGGNPNMKVHRGIERGAPEQGNPWASEASSYGAPKKNPRCRKCGKLQRGNGSCKCPVPEWDTRMAESGFQMQTWHEMWAREALRVLKPGGHLLAFGGTRTYHRLACAVEDAGFEIRDCLAWLYGSGFPKSLDVSKAIDKAAGAKREVVGNKPRMTSRNGDYVPFSLGGTVRWGDEVYAWEDAPEEAREHYARGNAERHLQTAPATPDAETWQGWGTALKPAHEPIVMARKPLSGTVAGNVLAFGVGAINVDACRIEGTPRMTHSDGSRSTGSGGYEGKNNGTWRPVEHEVPTGRWPANVVLDERAAELLDQQTGECPSGGSGKDGQGLRVGLRGNVYDRNVNLEREADSGGASRFLYVAKSSSAERSAGLGGVQEGAERNSHPT